MVILTITTNIQAKFNSYSIGIGDPKLFTLKGNTRVGELAAEFDKGKNIIKFPNLHVFKCHFNYSQ